MFQLETELLCNEQDECFSQNRKFPKFYNILNCSLSCGIALLEPKKQFKFYACNLRENIHKSLFQLVYIKHEFTGECFER